MAGYGATENGGFTGRRGLDVTLRLAVFVCAVAAVLCVLALSHGGRPEQDALLQGLRRHWASNSPGLLGMDENYRPVRKINYKVDADKEWEDFGDYKMESALKHLLYEEKRQREVMSKAIKTQEQ
jgi:hypothetical protein